MSSDYRFSGNKNDPLKRINKIAQSISVRRTGFNDANFRGKQFEDTDQECMYLIFKSLKVINLINFYSFLLFKSYFKLIISQF